MANSAYSQYLWSLLAPVMFEAEKTDIKWNMWGWEVPNESTVTFRLDKFFFTGIVSVTKVENVDGLFVLAYRDCAWVEPEFAVIHIDDLTNIIDSLGTMAHSLFTMVVKKAHTRAESLIPKVLGQRAPSMEIDNAVASM